MLSPIISTVDTRDSAASGIDRAVKGFLRNRIFTTAWWLSRERSGFQMIRHHGVIHVEEAELPGERNRGRE